MKDDIILFKKSQHGWRLMRQSLAVLARQKKLLVLPLAGRSFFFLAITAITGLVWAIRSGKLNYNSLSTQQILWGYVVILLVLWIGNLISAYFNAALTACLIQDENGQEIHITQGLRAAGHQFGVIFLWILTHFTFGITIMIFHAKLAKSKRIHLLLSGLSWGFAVFLVLPLIMNEPTGFWQTLSRSSRLMYGFAGKNPRVHYNYFILSLIARFMSVIPITIGYHFSQPIGIVVGMSVTFMMLLSVAVMLNGIQVVLLQALYQYIAHRKTIQYFQTQDLATAILPATY